MIILSIYILLLLRRPLTWEETLEQMVRNITSEEYYGSMIGQGAKLEVENLGDIFHST